MHQRLLRLLYTSAAGQYPAAPQPATSLEEVFVPPTSTAGQLHILDPNRKGEYASGSPQQALIAQRSAA